MPNITITLTAAQATRLSLSIQKLQELDAPATPAEARSFIIAHLKSVVRDTERSAAEAALPQPADFDVS